MRENYDIIKKYYKTINPKKSNIFLLFITAVITELLFNLSPIFYGKIISSITDKNLNKAYIFLSLYILVRIIGKLIYSLNFRIYKRYFKDVFTKLQSRIVDKLGELKLDYFSGENRGKILNVTNSDIDSLSYFGDWLSEGLVSVISMVFVMIIILKIDYRIGIFCIIINLINVLVLNYYNKLGEKIINNKKIATDKMTGFFSSMVNGINEIKVFNILPKISRIYDEKRDNLINEFNDLMDNRLIKNIYIPFITYIGESLVILYMLVMINNGKYDVDSLVVIVTYFTSISSSIYWIMSVSEQLRIINVSIDRYLSIVLYEVNDKVLVGNNENTLVVGNISFSNVSFSYEVDTPILKDINFNIPHNKVTAIVGESGSGKSTIFKLLLRFYKPNNGSITLDSDDLFSFSNVACSKNIAVVNQKPYFFNMSIKDNLALINNDFIKIKDACKRAHIDTFIESLPDKYDTIISEDASDISGGQKQRLAIARTLLKESKVIVFDEVTSSLDNTLSNNIFKLLDDLKKDHTVITITHKSREMKKADHIIVIDKGKIVGEGTHKSLIDSCSKYKEIQRGSLVKE